MGHLGETDLSPFLLSHHRGDRDGVCLSHDQSAHRVWSQAVRWAGCSPQIGAFHYFSNSRDLLAGPSPAQEERLAARAHGLLSCGCIPVEWVENFTAIFCFNSRLIPKQWSRIHACSALISWVCMEPPLSLSPHVEAFSFLWTHTGGKRRPCSRPSASLELQISTLTCGTSPFSPCTASVSCETMLSSPAIGTTT